MYIPLTRTRKPKQPDAVRVHQCAMEDETKIARRKFCGQPLRSQPKRAHSATASHQRILCSQKLHRDRQSETLTNFFKQDTSDHATFRGSSSDFHADKETMLDTSGRCNVPWVQLRPTPPPVRRSIRNWLLFRFLNLPSSWQVLSKMPSSLLLVPPSWARAWWVSSTWRCFVCISGVFNLWYSKIDLRAPLGTLPLLLWCCRPAASFSTDLLSFKYAHHA